MKNIIIVGGGITGLSAGVFAMQSGFRATILEQHSIPGGFSTSWKRGGYFFEGGMHWLTGSRPGSPLYKLWREVGALAENNPVHNRDPFITYDDGTQRVCLYRDVHKLKKHLLQVSPEDQAAIGTLCEDIERFGLMSMPITDVKGVKTRNKTQMDMKDMFKFMGIMPRMNKLGKMNCREYADMFQNKAIRTLLLNITNDERYYATAIIFTLAGLASGDGGYPEGGSLRMAQNIADNFTRLGGDIRYRTKVDEIVVEDGKATGVIVGEERLKADAVIVTVDALAAVDRLFEQPLHEPWMERMRRDTIPAVNSFLSLGIEADLSGYPETLFFPLDEPIDFGGFRMENLYVNNYASFAGYAPEGCTAVTMPHMFDTYDFWKQARADGSYAEKKQQLANIMTDRLARLVPETAGKVAVTDVATPLTYERYCGAYHGSWMSIVRPGQKMAAYKIKPKTIGQLYFAGQRMMMPGGLPTTVSTARSAVQHLCVDTDSVFQGEM